MTAKDGTLARWINPKDKGGPMTAKSQTARHTPINAWDVYLDNELVDTVFDQETEAEEIKRALVDHDGYNPNITVKKAPIKRASTIRKARGE